MLPLQNRRILITRTRKQASDLAAQLEALGAATILIPTIEIIPPQTYASLDEALTRLDTFDWLLFTSANAVEAFAQRRSLHPSNARTPKIAVVGPATARAVEAVGLPVALLPPRYLAESLAESLAPHAPGSRMLLIRAEDARDVLPTTLTQAGTDLTIAPAYSNRIPSGSISALQTLFANSTAGPDAITFTSASTARNLIALLDAADLTLSEGITLASIGPITSEALRELGHQPTIEAPEPTIPALVAALADHFTR
ncbi:uroporphyrinogen-III synthase [Edaphobacter aggregans]|uniref:uroporphyrinogen-III synthase n=1 Tax=Edaphobacter aggregans TaxID=570835 RepID=UPI000556E4C5|nr:uroporphyrinogen-III synthase [Edaphobacter aggregans]